MALDNLRGGTKRVVEENTPLNNLRGGTKRVVIVDGGGGSVDYAKTVQRAETMPTADASNAGQQFLYSGESDATYTHGYIYENVATTTSSSASAEQTVGATLSDIAVDVDTLESFTGWTTDNSLQIFYTADGWSVDATSLGVTYTGTPNVGDAITITYTAESTTYAWTRVDVQPAGSSLPSQTGQSGKFLTTDGTDASWSDKPLVNQKDLSTTNSIAVLYSGNQPTRVGDHCVVFGGNDFTNPSDYVIKIGGAGRVAGSYSTLVGYATGPSGVRQVTYGVCVGYQSRVGRTAMGIGVGNIAVGSITTSFEDYTITIGYHAAALAQGAIQIGHYEDPNNPDARTENSDANTFKVANANGNFELMNANGNLPADRLASTTGLADGNYRLRLTITNGEPTLSWVAE